MDYKDISSMYRFNATELFSEYMTPEIVNEITEKVVGSNHPVMKKDVRKMLDRHFNQLLKDKEYVIEKIQMGSPSTEVYYPINMDIHPSTHRKLHFDEVEQISVNLRYTFNVENGDNSTSKLSKILK